MCTSVWSRPVGAATGGHAASGEPVPTSVTVTARSSYPATASGAQSCGRQVATAHPASESRRPARVGGTAPPRYTGTTRANTVSSTGGAGGGGAPRGAPPGGGGGGGRGPAGTWNGAVVA